MLITRRQFGFAWAAASVATRPAHAAEAGAVIERRVYHRAGAVPSRALLEQCGLRILAHESSGMFTTLTLAFPSAADRTRAWDRFNTHPEWCALRAVREVRLHHLALTGV